MSTASSSRAAGTSGSTASSGKGTTFKIYFPRADADRAGHGSRHRASASTPRAGTETILLVEDEEAVRALARTHPSTHGYTVLEAADGAETPLLICEQHAGKIHLLLTDVVMPRMSGRELAERAAPLRPELKVLYMSGYTDDAVVRHGVLDADVAFLQKPFTPETLARAVRQAIETPDRLRSN